METKTPAALAKHWRDQAEQTADEIRRGVCPGPAESHWVSVNTLRSCARQLEAVMPKGPMGPVPHNGTDTSKAAAGTITDRVDRHKEIMDLFRKADSFEGLTCGQVEDRLPHRTHQSVSARIRELVKAGKLVDSGHRRKNPSTGRTARVYVPTGR